MSRVLVTGASGLLGRAVYRELRGAAEWEALGLAFSRAQGELRRVDLTQPAEVKAVVEEFKPTVIIHSAAERRPDIVENKPDATQAINIQATQTLCQAAADAGARVVFISTDYVFDGSSPPYQVDDKPNPLNAYGASKLAGEKVVLESSKGNSVLRVPVLYGEVTALDESAVTVLFSKVKDTSKNCVMSNYERRYPTHCADVAKVLRDLLNKQNTDSSLCGMFHWSGDENMTKYDMAVAMAEVFGLPSSHIIADNEPSAGAPRPYDAHIDPGRLEALGVCHRRPFRDTIRGCLEPHS